MNDFEKRWKRIQEQLGAEARGDTPQVFSSGRTLFGIKSSVELKMEQIAREDEEKRRAARLAKIRAERAAEAADNPTDTESIARTPAEGVKGASAESAEQATEEGAKSSERD